MMYREKPSICDVYLFNELMQINIAGFDLSDRPRVKEYVDRVAGEFQEYREVCAVIFKIMRKRNTEIYVTEMN